MPTVDSSVDAAHHRLSSKRKLDDYGPPDDDASSDLVSVRMRKDCSPAAVNSSNHAPDQVPRVRVSDARSAELSLPGSRLQFFVRMISEGNTIVIQANHTDTVRSLHERIQEISGIPVIEQRLIYRGKQLQWEQSLAECSIQNDAGLQLVGRMRSTEHPLAWQAIDDMVSTIWQLMRGQAPLGMRSIKCKLLDFLKMTPSNDSESAAGHLQILLSSSATAALVMLYFSPIVRNKEAADEAIRHFLNSCGTMLPKPIHSQCAPIVLEFCKLLGTSGNDDPLYLLCRSTLGSLVESVGISRVGTKYSDRSKGTCSGSGLIVFREILPFVRELANRLLRDLASSMDSTTSFGPLVADVRDFAAFLLPLRGAIVEQVGFLGRPVSLPLHESAYEHPCYGEEVEFLHVIFSDLLKKMDQCLKKMEDYLRIKKAGEGENVGPGCLHYLAILKELNGISRLYEGAEEQFWDMLRLRKASICALVMKYANRSDDNKWILEHKEVTDFEARKHLVMLLLPEVKEEYEELHEMLIDRSQILAESFEYIAHAEPEALHGGLFMEFKNEEATGPGVLREWFFLVCQEIFNRENALFVACPNDQRRFYPNPASKVDPLHLEYFNFSGRVIALALMHKVQVGVVFDRVFFLQLRGSYVYLEDIQDADPELYSSCKKILEMDTEFIDSDELGLTFVTEVEELGSRKIVELCPGGKNMSVNSRNRKEYVDLLIQHRFVTSTTEQVCHFAHGFADILCNSRLQRFFFQSLELEDLDSMLYGSESEINVKDWKAHTEYNGYKKTDPQILWFWQL
ncbi:E3 ubiquitin-protein ligase UPL5 isoform X2 [Malania oleifera]|uniref:E3 ubiquitin-protein ligase UPL5 isoform X2 n=1 Tax=Malania oleifera TaxID=397392 RepID=UPI0025AE62C4|nr:E3 ubiquitin-protein ligase UPL5 isoform X2 [Malania oleifera]